MLANDIAKGHPIIFHGMGEQFEVWEHNDEAHEIENNNAIIIPFKRLPLCVQICMDGWIFKQGTSQRLISEELNNLITLRALHN